MNRMEEYQQLLRELEQPVPELEHTVQRARRRRRRKRVIVGPLLNMAAVFALFVALVNFCAPVAYACSQVPFLRELAEFVQFSPSLSEAVDHTYVQTLDLEQSNETVTARVEYLIVDRKQVNVYYRLSSRVYTELSMDPDFKKADGSGPQAFIYTSTPAGLPDNALRSVVVDFGEETDVPDSLQLHMRIFADSNDPVATFDFLLEFDPNYTEQGEILAVNQTVELNGQSITVQELEVYPTHIRVQLGEDPDNTAWLKKLDFYIETRDGTRFLPSSGGVTSSGAANTKSMLTYWADTTWFRRTNRLKLVITGAEWLEKDAEMIHVDLEAGTAENVPSYMTFEGCERVEDRWNISFRSQKGIDGAAFQMFGMTVYDRDGDVHKVESYSYFSDQDTFTETMHLENYRYTEIWLMPRHTHVWYTETPIEIKVS